MPELAELEKPCQSIKITASEQEALDNERIIHETNPLRLVGSKYLLIKTKAGELIRLTLNSTQRKLFNKILELRRNNKPVRIWLLKYRQGGISTLVEAIIYALTSLQNNRNSLIMADEKDKSNYLFDMSKLYQEQLELHDKHLTTPLNKSNEKKLEFAGTHSQIIIETAENVQSARAFTYQYVHLSEVAFFRDLKAVLDALNQSVPDHADTMILGETTANGMNEFYEQWVRAIEGKSDWIPLFFGWFEMAEYSMPLQSGVLYPLEGILFDADTSKLTFETEERELQLEFNLTDEQLNWRRWAIVNKCQGDIMTFKREYPSTWQEAFTMSGSMFFDRRGLQKQVEKRPVAIGELFYQEMKWTFRDLPAGRLLIYEKPSQLEQYIIASDASEAVGGDEAAIVVLNKRLNTTAAIAYGQYTPEEVAEMSIALGNYYNNGLVVPENKGYGYMVCQLVYAKYGNIYKRIKDATGTDKPTEELGFNTNAVTRPTMLAQMSEEIKYNSTGIYSKALIDECRTFIIKRDRDGKVTKIEAEDGKQDGLVMARAIAGIVRTQYPYKASNSIVANAKRSQLVKDMKKSTSRFGG